MKRRLEDASGENEEIKTRYRANCWIRSVSKKRNE